MLTGYDQTNSRFCFCVIFLLHFDYVEALMLYVFRSTSFSLYARLNRVFRGPSDTHQFRSILFFNLVFRIVNRTIVQKPHL